MKNFPEVFLHYVWKLQLLEQNDLKTVGGEPLELQQVGLLNHHAGPDFLNARIKIGATLWAGSVEIHKKSSDWLAHKHSDDRAYDNTILHVVYEHDHAIKRASGELIPTLELKDKIPAKYVERYWKLIYNNYWIPCEPQMGQMSQLSARLWLWIDRLATERLEQKTSLVQAELKQTKNNWEETFYRLLARNFGVKQNTTSFEALAKSLPLKILTKHKQSIFQLEALLFGQAGFLTKEMKENYPLKLQKEYQYLQQKYQLKSLNVASWKFSKMRPAAFPTIRLAQLARLIHQSTHLFSKILAEDDPKQIMAFFEVELQDYWLNHYRLGEESVSRKKSLGKATVQLILINTVVPLLFEYGKSIGNNHYKQKAMRILEQLPAEKNSIMTHWENLGIKPNSALDSQALLHLKNNYCKEKKCLDCAIGHKIMNLR